MNNHEKLKASLVRLGGYQFINSGNFEDTNVDWVKVRYEKNETGYRSLEFLAWVTTDMMRARQQITFFPTAAPPYLNKPGNVLSFVLQFYTNEMGQDEFDKNVDFINNCIDQYYDSCKI